VFVSTIVAMQTAAADADFALRNLGIRTWFLGRTESLPLVPDWSGDPNDTAGMSHAFDREAVGIDYAEGLSAAAPVGQTAACKIQSDYLAMAERAMRSRHMSYVRSRLHAASRRSGHAMAAGSLGRAVTMVEDFIAAGNE
jgi:hypothetical protein